MIYIVHKSQNLKITKMNNFSITYSICDTTIYIEKTIFPLQIFCAASDYRLSKMFLNYNGQVIIKFNVIIIVNKRTYFFFFYKILIILELTFIVLLETDRLQYKVLTREFRFSSLEDLAKKMSNLTFVNCQT